MKNIIIVSLTILATFLMSSCAKNNSISEDFKDNLLIQQREQLPSVIEVLNLLQEPTNGYLFVTSFSTLAMQNNRGNEILIGGFCNDNTDQPRDFGGLSINEITIECDSELKYGYTLDQDFSSALGYFGQSTTVSLEGSEVLPSLNTDFYIPKMMTITNMDNSSNSISEGMEITWDDDLNNTFGVGIAIIFDPLSTENDTKDFSNYQEVRTAIHTEDDGSYTITSSDLSGIPAGSSVEFYIGRGNYKNALMSDDNLSMGIITYSVVKSYMTY